MYESQVIHGSHQDDPEGAAMLAMGPQAKPTPYGQWKTVEK